MPFSSDIFLRRAERDDLDVLVEWMEDPDFLLFLYGDPARSPKQVREHMVTILGQSEGRTAPSNLFLMLDSASSGTVGLISLQHISWRNQSCSIDVYIGAKQRRATHIAALSIYRALEYCFLELNLHRVGAYIYAFNTQSWRLMELSGAPRELTLREHVARDGELHDLYCYGLLRADFERLKERIAGQIDGVALKDMIEQKKRAEDVEKAP